MSPPAASTSTTSPTSSTTRCPEDEKTYVHRIGRTGRAGRTGVAVTLVDWDELARWKMIDKALGLGCPDPPRPTPVRRICTPNSTSRPTRRHRGHAAQIAGQTRHIGSARRRPTAPRSPKSSRQRQRTRGGKSQPATPLRPVPPTAQNPPATQQRLPAPRTPATALTTGAAAVVAPASRRAWPRMPTEPVSLPPDGQTGTPHQGRCVGRGNDRGGGRRGGGFDLVDQRCPGHDQPARGGPPPSPRSARQVPASLKQLWTAPTHRPTSLSRSSEPSSPPTGVPSKGVIRSPARCGGATHAAAICAGSPGSTATRSRSTETTGAAVRSARSTDRPVAAARPKQLRRP